MRSSVDWSEDASTLVGPPGRSRNAKRLEALIVHKWMKRAREGMNTAVIGVVQPGTLATLEALISKGRSWWKVWKKSGNRPFLATTEELLQDTIDSLENLRHCQELTILASPAVDDIAFDVDAPFRTLGIHWCGHKHGQESLLIDGTSTFNDVRLDEWQREKRRHHNIYIGKGVGIGVDPSWHPSAARCANTLSDAHKELLKQHLETIKTKDKSGNWWDQHKGQIAAILGIVTTTTKLAVKLKVAIGGAFVDFNCAAFSLRAGAFGIKASSVATAAGPAVLLGVGVAAAVYFIPWADLFSWLGDVFSRFCSWILRLWNQFQSFLGSWSQGEQTVRSRGRGSVPMRFN